MCSDETPYQWKQSGYQWEHRVVWIQEELHTQSTKAHLRVFSLTKIMPKIDILSSFYHTDVIPNL